MVIFKEKLFWVGAALTVGSTALGIGQAAKQGKEAQKQADQMERSNMMIAQQLNKIAKQNNPAKNEAAGAILQQNYSAAALGKTVVGLGKDLGKVALQRKSHLGQLLVGGATMAAGGYVADKIIQNDIKKTEEKQKTYSIPSSLLKSGKSMLKSAMKSSKKVITPGQTKAVGVSKKGVSSSSGVGIGLALGGGIPLMSYYTKKKSEQSLVNDVANSSAPRNEKSFSAAALTSAATKVGKKILGASKSMYKSTSSTLKKAGKATMGGVSSFMGGGGYSGVEKFGRDVLKAGQKSGNKLTQKIGTTIIKNPNLAVAASIPVGATIWGAGYGLGEKAVKEPLKALDKNAYGYIDNQEKEVTE